MNTGNGYYLPCGLCSGMGYSDYPSMNKRCRHGCWKAADARNGHGGGQCINSKYFPAELQAKYELPKKD